MKWLLLLFAVLFASPASAQSPVCSSPGGLAYVQSAGCPVVPLCSPVTLPGTFIYQTTAFTDSWTTIAGSSTLATNAILSPACTKTAATVQEGSGTSVFQATKTITATITVQQYTISDYCGIAVGSRNCIIQAESGATTSNNVFAIFNATTCAFVASGVNGTGFTVNGTASSAANNVFCKISLTYTPPIDTSVVLNTGNASGSTGFYTGDGTSTNKFYGLSLCVGASC